MTGSGGRLEGLTAFITGAGQGIGRACAIAFAQEGAQVIATSRTGRKLADLPRINERIRPITLDVTDADAVVEVMTAAGDVDVLVNCAGWVPTGSIMEVGADDWAIALDQNVTSMYRTIRAVLPGMRERGRGSIINVSSVVSSISGAPNRAAYGTTKAAVIGLTKAVAADYIRDGITCNALCPGTTGSPSFNERVAISADPEVAREAFIARHPMGRIGTSEEMASAALWLASRESAFVTGAEIVVDGGQSL